MQIRDERRHLLFGEAPVETGHHSPACQYVLPHRDIRGRRAAGQGLALKDAMQIGRNLLQRQIIVFVAMGAADLIQMLARGFLRGQRRTGAAARKAQAADRRNQNHFGHAAHPPDGASAIHDGKASKVFDVRGVQKSARKCISSILIIELTHSL